MALKILHFAAQTSLANRITEQLNSGAVSQAAAAIPTFGMESLDQVTATTQESGVKTARSIMENIVGQQTDQMGNPIAGTGLEGLSDAQIEAGAISLVAAAGLEDYRSQIIASAKRAASSSAFNNVSGARYGSANPKMGYGNEAFEQTQDFTPQKNQTVEYNTRAAKQDAVGEALFPTTTLTPNDIGLNIEVPIDIVEPFIKHKATGEETDWNRKKLINAIRDPSILRNDSIQLIPFRPADGKNEKYFAPEVPKFTRPQNLEAIDTGALKPGVNIGFIGLCSTPSLVAAGALESSDQIDTSVKLHYVWIEVSNAGGTKEVIKLRTDHMDGSTFQKSQEYDKFQTSLNFIAKAYQLTAKNTKTIDGPESTLLKPLFVNDNIIGLELSINGTLNHEKGGLVVNSLTAPAISRIYNPVEKEEESLEGDLKDVIEGLTFRFVGYQLKAQLRNSNFRTREQRIDRQTSNYKYLVQLGAPITAIAPDTDAWGSAQTIAVDTLVNATYARNSAMAISRVFDYIDTMRTAGITNNGLWQRYDENNIEGVGKAVVDPWFGEGTYNIKEILNSIKSQDRRADTSEQILNIIRNYAYRMNAESGYKVALHQLYGETTPTLIIATDNIIAQYLMEVGDLRTAGITFKTHVVTSDNIEMRGKVILTLSRMKSGGLDLLTFGMHLWVPEIVATLSVMRNGAFVKETMVQPRNLHVVVCPIIALLTITGLDDAYDGNIVMNNNIVKAEDGGKPDGIDKTDLDGLKQPGAKD